MRLPVEPQAPICPDCGWRVDTGGHEANCEVPVDTVPRGPAYVARPNPVDVDLDELLDAQLPIPQTEETRP